MVKNKINKKSRLISQKRILALLDNERSLFKKTRSGNSYSYPAAI
ncbi:hypothetical protein EMIT036CA2_10720 [Chryseobacterium sp. IT-36CA2]